MNIYLGMFPLLNILVGCIGILGMYTVYWFPPTSSIIFLLIKPSKPGDKETVD